jgi:hypothetical protein
MASPARAVTMDFDVSGDIGPLGPGDTFFIDAYLTLELGENPNVWSWSLECTGCVVTHFTFLPVVDWDGILTPSLTLFPDDFVGSPDATPGTTAGPIGGLTFVGPLTGQGLKMLIGTAEVDVTATSGGLTSMYTVADGFFCQPDECTWSSSATFGSVSWVPEPTTALLLVSGLGLGVVGGHNRKPHRNARS